MMSQPDSFEGVLARLRQGDEDAAAEVFNRFADRLIRLARTRLDARVRQKLDPEDVLQSVFRSFFVRQAEGQFELETWDSLWSLLVRITLRKCGRRVTALRAERRDLRREVRCEPLDDESRSQWEAMARDPTPEEVVALTEILERLLGGLDQRQQEMVVLRLQGCTIPEISQAVGRTERTVNRVLAEVREALKRLEDLPPG